MKYSVLFLFFAALLSLSGLSQITTPIIKAGFGVDADFRANFFNGFVQSGNDDWFNNGTAGTGNFIIDTTGAAAIVSGYITNPATRLQTLFRTMRFPQYSVQNNRLLLDAVYIRDYHGDDSTVFASGSSKNGDNPNNWNCPVSQGIPDKNDILDMLMHVRRAGPNSTDSLWMFGGLSLDNTTGNRYVDFEMYQTDIFYDRPTRKFYGYGPDAGHTSWQFDASGNVTVAGDIILTAEYQSSSLTAIEARIWVNSSALSITPAAFSWGGQFDGSSVGATYGYANIQPNSAGAYYTGLQCGNNTWTGPFSVVLQNNSVVTTYAARQFVEFSVNLTKLGLDPVSLLGGGGNACGMPFRRILVKTRASSAFTSELKDFVGPIDLFIAPRVNADADAPVFCTDSSYSTLSVINPHPSSTYTWATTNGHIVGTNIGDSIVVDSSGTYIVTQRLMAGCPAYATDTVIVTRIANCNLLSGYIRSFTGLYDEIEKRVRLNWQVLNNETIDSFLVESSYDGKLFTIINRLEANKEMYGEVAYYGFDEPFTNHAQAVYYRIRLLNKDGEIKDSRIISLYIPSAYDKDIIVYPNPVTEKYVQVSIKSYENALGDIHIMDQQGKIIMRRKESFRRGQNVSTIYLPAQQNGIYYVIVRINNKMYRERMVVIE
jgi:hypothetical protein